jgi:hypothetical protein
MQKPVEEGATYATVIRFGSEYKLERLELETDVRDAVRKCGGQFVESYGPIPGWDLLIIADFPTTQNSIEFRNTLKNLGMWKVEATPSLTISQLQKSAHRTHATSGKM